MTDKKSGCKCFKKIIGGVVLLLIIGGAFLYMNMGSIAKTMAEKIGSEALGVKVAIGSIDINLTDKSVTVHKIRIANPKGYSNPNAMEIDLVNIAMDSFSKELLTFNDVTVKGSELFLEVTGKGTNLSALKDNIAKNKKAPQEKAQYKNEPPKVILKHFLLADAQLHPTITLIGGELKPVTVPDVKLTGIGVKQNGILAREAIAQIWNAVSSKAMNASSSAGFLQNISIDNLKDISGSVKVPEDILDKTGVSLDDATKTLEGIFGK